MNIFKFSGDLQTYLHNPEIHGKTLGFIPTMGALHPGHLQLIKRSQELCQNTIASIFINPTQFNNHDDFLNYPVTLENDVYALEKIDLDILFLPDSTQIYDNANPPIKYDLGYIEHILEGKYRPGHFQGVCQVVDRLMNVIKPTHLFLGQKDFQQCMIIEKMISAKGYNTQIVICPTIREEDGLAMSSRNLRLSDDEKKIASEVYTCLKNLKENKNNDQLHLLVIKANKHLTAQGFRIDYLGIYDQNTLLPVEKISEDQLLVALFAGYLGEIRLIDNMVF